MARATRAHAVETRGDRAALAQHAGWGRISLASVLAGTLVAYGAFAVLLAITAAVAESIGIDTDLSTNDWRSLGAVGGAVVAAVLLACYLFGGYVAGRMARRAGATNGLLVFVLGVLVAAGVTALVNVFTDGDAILQNLRNVGVPTSGEEWRDIGTVAGLGSLLAMIVGAVVGGILGERWHAKLLARAADPSVGPEARARAEAEHHRSQAQKAEERARESRLGDTTTTTTTTDDDRDRDRDREVVYRADDRHDGDGRSVLAAGLLDHDRDASDGSDGDRRGVSAAEAAADSRADDEAVDEDDRTRRRVRSRR